MQGVEIEIDRTQSLTSVHIDVDGLGGGELKGYPGTSICITTDVLKYLDVIDCSSLVHLDLSHCQPGSHITIRHCPSLREIRVRADGSGAVIHLDAGDQIPSLQVDGLVDQIDACWTSGQLSVNSTDCPWNGLWATHRLDSIPDNPAATSAECWILLAPEMAHVVIDTPKLRHLYVSGGRRLQALSVVSLCEKHAQIELQGIPELTAVDIHASASSCRVRDCRYLTSLSGNLTDVHIASSAQRVDELRLEVACERVVLSHSELAALFLSQPSQLSLIHCRSLNKVTLAPLTTVHCEGPVPATLLGIATIMVDESLVSSLVKMFPRDPNVIMQELVTLIPSMSSPSPCVKALQLLQQLSELEAPLEQVWQLRLGLSAKHLSPHGKPRHADAHKLSTASGKWSWHLPDDLCREGWMADYLLWVKCASANSDALRYRRVMVRACVKNPDGLAMQTVIQAMMLHHDTTHCCEVDLWRDVLLAIAELPSMSMPAWSRYACALTVRYGRNEIVDRAYLRACRAHLPVNDLLILLKKLGLQRPEIRACLYWTANCTGQWYDRDVAVNEVERYQATAAALLIAKNNCKGTVN
ncbi:hypothetical protein [Halomonas sp. MCCC 1A11062]|uniref:hypothetical protein n=1 Tax=Halomonas sp. MCCC 1A11062 TaxID=2733485 RepID=UPI001F2290DD|nr:hypothetical protein [Halomonas sp. MCCC 1A11062]MCE8039277.1 hypothetical protein [Halomonas sp. MCCC 1A11062]